MLDVEKDAQPPAEGATPQIPTRQKSLLGQISDDINEDHADLVLFACCLATGLTDSTMFNAYATFVSMQTGNTVFVALGASGQDTKPYAWALCLMAMICFVLGALFFSRLHAYLGARRRGTLVLSFLVQSICVIIAAALPQSGAINGRVPQQEDGGDDSVRWNELAPIALLSFQAAAQLVCSRALNIGETPTVVITSLLSDLMSDMHLFAPLAGNVKRNRRVVAFVMTLVGAIAGGWISKATKGVAGALWVVAGIKLGITVVWMFWKSKT